MTGIFRGQNSPTSTCHYSALMHYSGLVLDNVSYQHRKIFACIIIQSNHSCKNVTVPEAILGVSGTSLEEPRALFKYVTDCLALSSLSSHSYTQN